MTFFKIGLLSLLAYCGSQVSAADNSTCTSKYAPCYYQGVGCNGGQNCFALNCDVQKSYPNSCYPAPLCVSFTDDFTNTNDLVEISKFNGDPYLGPKWMTLWEPNYASIENGELVLGMKLKTEKNAYGHPEGQGSTVASVRWIQYGNVTARVKTGSVTGGVVTSFIIKNPQGDEIDFEWVGGNPSQVQTNYYYDGIQYYDHNGTTVYGNMVAVDVGDNTSSDYNEYMIQWEEEFIKFHVNKKVVRTVHKKDTWDPKSKVYQFPARLAPVQLSIWDGGSQSKYTSEWAGGPTNWSNPNMEYKAYFDYIDVQCKYNGNQTVPWVTPTIPTPTPTPTPTSVFTSTFATTTSTSPISSVTSSTSLSTFTLASSDSITVSSTCTEFISSSPSIRNQTDPTINTSENSCSNVQFGLTLSAAILLLASYILY